MAQFTFLAIGRNRGDKTGKLSDCKHGKGVWGKKEIPPAFEHIPFNGTREEANWIFRCCKWDYEKGVFIHKDDPTTEFDRDYDVVPKTKHFGSTAEKYQKDKALAELLTGLEVNVPCAALRAPYLSAHTGEDPSMDMDERQYWVKHYWPYRKADGVKALIEAVKYGVYADTREAFRALDTQLQTAILALGSKEDQQYKQWLFMCDKFEDAVKYW